MKYSVRRLSVVVILAVTFSLSAFGGQLPFPVNDPPPTPPPSQSVIVLDGETDTAAKGSSLNQIPDETTADPMAEIVLAIMRSVLSLL